MLFKKKRLKIGKRSYFLRSTDKYIYKKQESFERKNDMEYKPKKRRTHPQRKHRQPSEDTGFSAVVRFCIIGAVISIITSLILTLILSWLCLFAPDPLRLAIPAGLCIIYASAISGGIFTGLKLKRDKWAAIIGSALCGLLFFIAWGIFGIILSLFELPSVTDDYKTLLILARALAIPFSMLGTYLCIKKKKHYRRHR